MITVAAVSEASGPVRAALHIEPDWRRDTLKIVAFVQERRSRRVLATAMLPLDSDRSGG
jgi:hypothetical protein